ncbi:hypothetical protein EYF80_030449 [Liparis tanakae]|uniref:Uncharacterized protein n=1 Tax=Liparis tanakae TaxID=230148 RepID=A0A4Z2H0S1_9TELE|nr:hypothetical protein EYF80_030449 [Liparis tanakae]
MKERGEGGRQWRRVEEEGGRGRRGEDQAVKPLHPNNPPIQRVTPDNQAAVLDQQFTLSTTTIHPTSFHNPGLLASSNSPHNELKNTKSVSYDTKVEDLNKTTAACQVQLCRAALRRSDAWSMCLDQPGLSPPMNRTFHLSFIHEMTRGRHELYTTWRLCSAGTVSPSLVLMSSAQWDAAQAESRLFVIICSIAPAVPSTYDFAV